VPTNNCSISKIKIEIATIRFLVRKRIANNKNTAEKMPLWLKVITENLFICLHIKTIQLEKGVIIKIIKCEKDPAIGAKIAAIKPRTVIGAMTGATKIFAGIVASEN